MRFLLRCATTMMRAASSSSSRCCCLRSCSRCARHARPLLAATRPPLARARAPGAAAALLEVAPARADGNVTVIPSTLATREDLEALDRSRQAMPPPEAVIPKGSDLELMLGSSAGALDPRAHSGP